MALSDFRLSQDQGDTAFVVVLADDDKIRVIARIAREAIDDYFPRHRLTQSQRVALVQSNLPQIAEIIGRRYLSGKHTIYTDSLGVTCEHNRLINLRNTDLHHDELLSDAVLFEC
jgi:hypothetical protein